MGAICVEVRLITALILITQLPHRIINIRSRTAGLVKVPSTSTRLKCGMRRGRTVLAIVFDGAQALLHAIVLSIILTEASAFDVNLVIRPASTTKKASQST